MRIPEQRYRCPLGQLQSEARMDPEASSARAGETNASSW